MKVAWAMDHTDRGPIKSFSFKTIYSVYYFTYYRKKKLQLSTVIPCWSGQRFLSPPVGFGLVLVSPCAALSAVFCSVLVVRGTEVVTPSSDSLRSPGPAFAAPVGAGHPPALAYHSLGQWTCRGRMNVLGGVLWTSRSRPGLWLPLLRMLLS